METRIEVENIRCGGCANRIRTQLLKNHQVQAVAVDIEQQIVTIQSEVAIRSESVQILLHLGYPEAGSVTGLDVLKGKAKSVVSCAIGKVSG